jgi:hypothetical protein
MSCETSRRSRWVARQLHNQTQMQCNLGWRLHSRTVRNKIAKGCCPLAFARKSAMTNRILLTEVLCVKASYFKVLVSRLCKEFSVSCGANKISERRWTPRCILSPTPVLYSTPKGHYSDSNWSAVGGDSTMMRVKWLGRKFISVGPCGRFPSAFARLVVAFVPDTPHRPLRWSTRVSKAHSICRNCIMNPSWGLCVPNRKSLQPRIYRPPWYIR